MLHITYTAVITPNVDSYNIRKQKTKRKEVLKTGKTPCSIKNATAVSSVKTRLKCEVCLSCSSPENNRRHKLFSSAADQSR